MPDDFPLSLNLPYVLGQQPAFLLDTIKRWILTAKPIALVHPHGFLIVLLHRSDREDWRFHVWPRGKRLIAGMPGLIHTHDKVVESRVLKGEITNCNYSVISAEGGSLPVYEVEYVGDKYKSEAPNVLTRSAVRVEPTSINQQLVRAADNYRVDAHVFHQAIVPESGPTCTIVCMHSQSPGTIKVLGVDGYPDRIEFQRPERSAVEMIELAEI